MSKNIKLDLHKWCCVSDDWQYSVAELSEAYRAAIFRISVQVVLSDLQSSMPRVDGNQPHFINFLINIFFHFILFKTLIMKDRVILPMYVHILKNLKSFIDWKTGRKKLKRNFECFWYFWRSQH